jgi:hypothetical protein
MMGGFINSQADNEICEALNKRFSDDVDPDDDDGLTYLEQLRDHFRNREDFLDNSHKLNRVFHRLAITVTGKRVPRNKKSRHRWLFLLRRKLPRDVPDVEKAIRNQLKAILGQPSSANPAGATSYVTFSTRHVKTDTQTFELAPKNAPSPTVLQDANGKTYCTIILECHVDAPLEDSANEPDPPPEDNGEKDFASLASRAPVAATKSSSRKSSAKKEAAGKKTPVKKAKKGKSRR